MASTDLPRQAPRGVARLKETLSEETGRPVAYEGVGLRGSAAGAEFLIVVADRGGLAAVLSHFGWDDKIIWDQVKACKVVPGSAS